jgi:class 3 adenylate cyclase/DNA-binding CsgD family transcriptional regulator
MIPQEGIVALLFTDLVGSTELLGRLGDDAGERVRRAHFRVLREAVTAAGGQEVKNLGDGLMVSFESAVAGVECAVGIQRAVERHNRRARPGERLRVRVGLHVGEPITEEDDYFGTPVVVAKRLCDAAQGGQVLASELVRGLVGSRGGFVFQPVGPLALKGLAEPLPAHEVRWAPAPGDGAGGPPVLVDPGAVRLVGREAELEQLEAELALAASGRLRVVLLVGEGGIGKTRLAGELVARHAGEVIALSARAYPLGATASLGLWVEALERHLRALDPEEVSALCGAEGPDLAALLPSVAAPGVARPPAEPARIRLLGALANLLARLAASGPLVVVLDDVHLADGSSWEALNYLARNLAWSPVLFVLAARPEELAAQAMASEMLLGLEQEGYLTRRRLEALSADELRELAEAVTGLQRAGDALVEWLMGRSRGSPLFATGLLRALVEEGADLSRPALRALPEDLAERVAVRLRQIDAGSRAVLELVSVVGYRVGFSELLSLCGQPLDRLAVILDGLVRSRFVAEDEQGRELTYEVAHPLIAEAVYQDIGATRRRALHRHVARALVAAGRPGPAAAHFVASADVGDPEAIAGLQKALAQAEARELHRESLALLQALLELLPAGDRRWLDVFDSMARQPEWVVDHRADVGAEVGIAAMRRVDQVLAGSPDLSRRAAVKFTLASLLAWSRGEVDAGIQVCEEARALFAEAGETRRELLAMNELGYLRYLGPDFAALGRAALEVLARDEAVGDRLVELQALCALAHHRQLGGEITESLAVIDRALAIARADRKLYRTSYLLAQRAWSLALLGRLPEADAHLADAQAANPAYRDTFVLDYGAMVDHLAGRLDAPPVALKEMLGWTGGYSRRRALVSATAAVCIAEVGDGAGAKAILEPQAAVYEGRDWCAWSDVVHWAEAVAAWLVGDPGTARAKLIYSIRRLVAGGLEAGPWALGMLADQAEIAAFTAHRETAADVVATIEGAGTRPDSEPLRALVLFARGGAALAGGADTEAVPLLEAAAQAFERAGWPLWSGRALALLGRARATSGDRDGAVDALRRAGERFEACGATVRQSWVSDELRRLGARGRRATAAVTGAGALTRREREVVRLALQGLSTKEIAARLFIGGRTVETHLAGAYAKLGVSSRLDLVRLAPELDS